MADFDSAVGAVLEIPQEALNKIGEAEKKIRDLATASQETADAINRSFSVTAIGGLDKFIQKITDTQTKLQELGGSNIQFNINTNVAQQNIENLSNQTKKTETDISTVAQQSSKFLDQIDFSKPKESFEQLKITFGELEKELNNLISGRKATEVGTSEAQALNNIIASLREYINLQKQSDAEKDKASRKQADDTILKEQRVLLERILQLTKDINAEELKQARYKELGRAIPQEDINRLDEYKTKLIDTAQAYSTLSQRIGEMSEKGAKAFNDAEIKAQLAATREETKAQENLNQALQQTAKLTSETKLKAPGISSREEAAYASQLVAVYQQMIQLKKMEGDMQAKIATQGYAQTAAQTDYLNQITAEYRRLESTLSNVSGKYAEIDRVAKSNFERSLTLQEAENATKLADAYKKAAEAAEKKRKAESKSEQVDLSKDKAEYKKVLTLIEQLEKAQRKLNQALSQANLPSNLSQQLQSALQSAESSLNTLYNRRSQLEAERGNELIEIQRQQEVKKAENAIAEHEKAEKEKTRISKEQAQERYNEEMRQKRLENQDLTAQSKIQRMRIANAKDDRELLLFEQRRKEVERLRREIDALDKTDANYQKNLDRLNQRINELLGTQQRRIQYTAEEARNMAKTATNLSQLENAYRALKDAMSTLDPKSKEWQELNKLLHEVKPKIDNIKRSMGEFQSQTKRTGDLMDGLKGKIAAAFSIAAISGFIKKVVETRAQFELQRVALGAILQDTDKANKTFLQVQQMALQSPFSIMQLERATKQVAAFGFEADKVLPTMKMLADMSAGLGVEIDRLVLVMGHLKARNYLEGTMVRQFTNAGFNVLGELAKYYTELEGKMVSVAEVQTRVKKKMVEFGDVEEVLKRVTAAGGMFYDMQKKQSDSLWGQMQRITDAYDLMLNEIGKDNQNLISRALTAVRSLIQHWRILAPTIKTVGYAMAAVFAAKGIQALLLGFTKFGRILTKIPAMLRLITLNIKTMNLAWSTTGIGALVAIATTAISVFAGLRAEANALNEELEHIGEDSVKNLNNMIADYVRLANVVSDTNKTYVEQEDALKDIKRIYSELLPDYMKEREYIQGLNGDYRQVIDTLSEYYQAKEYQQKYETVMASKQAKDVMGEVERTLLRMNEEGALGMLFPEAQVKAWAEKVSHELLSGKIPNSAEKLKEKIEEIFPTHGDLSKYVGETYGKADLTDVVQANQKVQDSLEGIALASSNAANANEYFYASFKPGEGMQALERIGNEQERLSERAIQLQETIQMIKGLEGAPGMAGDQSKLPKLEAELASVTAQLDSLAQARSKVIAQQFKENVEEETKKLTDEVKAWWENKIAMEDAVKQGKNVGKTWTEMVKKDEDLRESLNELEKEFGIKLPMDILETAETTYELDNAIGKISKDAFPHVAQVAKEKMKEVLKSFLEAKGGVLSFLKSIYDVLPDTLKGLVPDVGALFEANEAELAALRGEMKETSNEAEDASKSLKQVYSEVALKNAKKYEATMQRTNTIIGDGTKTRAEMAKEFHQEAESLKSDLKSFDEATDQTAWLESERKTLAEIAQMRKDAEAYAATAKDLGWTDSKNKGKGKDELLDLWKNRLKAVEDFYKRYEELRKHFDTTESLDRDREAFTDLFNTLNLNMEQIIAEGMDKQGLANNIKRMTEEVRKVRPQLVDEFQKAFADTQIQVDFKIKEDSEDDLKRQIEEMFDSYELTKELKDVGLNVDLTYMVGGKPTTLQDIRDEIARLQSEGGGSADAENRIKILKEAEKKITDIELKEQKQRLKNYEKYLKAMYSERAKTMIDSYATMYQMEKDFQKNIQQLEQEMMAEGTTDARKKELADLIETLKNQAHEAGIGIQRELSQSMAKADWESFKGSEIFVAMYQDLDTLGRKGIDMLITRLQDLRSELQSMDNVDFKAVREITQYIEKLKNTKVELSPYGEFKKAISAVNQLKKAYGSIEQAQIKLINLNDEALDYEKEIADLETLIGLRDRLIDSSTIDAETYARLSSESAKFNGNLEQGLEYVREQLKLTREQAANLAEMTDDAKKINTAYQKQIAQVQALQGQIQTLSDSCYEIAEALGTDIDEEWKNFSNAVLNATFQTIQLQLQLQLMKAIAPEIGAAMNQALGIIGWIATALQVVASLLTAIFAMHDKKLQKQIEAIKEEVDALDKSFQKLQKSIEKAFTVRSETNYTDKAIRNIEKQKQKYQEMIALEKDKKKTDNEKIKEYQEKIESLNETLKELYETRHEKWGSTNDVWGEANNWVDAWLDAFKETGDGLDSLQKSWDEYYENLVKKMVTSAVLGKKMDKWIQDINDVIDRDMDEYSKIDAYKNVGELLKKDFENINKDILAIFKYAGIGGSGEYVLSDLQKGIQNITEPQAAAIEAYLNSMRFAVYRHTEQLDILITTIQAQYGAGESPMLQEIRLIRSVVQSINTQLSRVIVSKNAVNPQWKLSI